MIFPHRRHKGHQSFPFESSMARRATMLAHRRLARAKPAYPDTVQRSFIEKTYPCPICVFYRSTKIERNLIQNQDFGRRKIWILKRKSRFGGFRYRWIRILGSRSEIREELRKPILKLILKIWFLRFRIFFRNPNPTILTCSQNNPPHLFLENSTERNVPAKN